MRVKSLALVLVLVVTACADVPGDPDTVVLNGEPLAGYAWSGPASYDADPFDEELDLVAWQIWFTNTEDCPTRPSDHIAGLLIVGPERVVPPSTQLPTLPSMTLPIVPFWSGMPDITEPEVRFSAADVDYVQGTLSLTQYDEGEIAGHFEGTGDNYLTNQDVEIQGTFVARRCSRIHD